MFACLRTQISTRIRNEGNKTSPHSVRDASTTSYHEIDEHLIAQHSLSEGKYDKINNTSEEQTELAYKKCKGVLMFYRKEHLICIF